MTSLTCHDTSTPFLARVVKTTRRAISKFSQHHKQVRPNASQTTTPTQSLQKAPAQRTTDKTSVYYYLRRRLARRLQLIGPSRYVLLLAGSEVVAGDCPCCASVNDESNSSLMRLRQDRVGDMAMLSILAADIWLRSTTDPRPWGRCVFASLEDS